MPSDARNRSERPWVLLDTNAWFLPGRAGTDLADEIDRKVPNARLGVPRSVLAELERLVARRAPGAELALALARTAEVVANTGRGDAAVEEVARRQRAWVVTADRRLATRLVEGGVPVLVPRDRVRLDPSSAASEAKRAPNFSAGSFRKLRQRLRTELRSSGCSANPEVTLPDQDLMNDRPNPQFGSGIVGICDVCGKRQAVIVLQKERFKLCVIDFLNKTWAASGKSPGAPLPPYRSERIFFPTRTEPTGRAPAIVLSPTKQVKHPVVLVVPDVYGLTTTVLDAAIRFAREGFEVLLPDVGNTGHVGPGAHLSLRMGARTRGGVSADGKLVSSFLEYYRDALAGLRAREMADGDKSAVFGVSYGASLAALLAAQEPKLGAAVLAYPVPIRPADTLRLVTAPLLVVGGSADAATARFLADLRALTGFARPPEVLELAGARHDFLARDMGAYDLTSAEKGWDRILKFLKQSLMPPPPRPPSPPAAKPAPTIPPAVPTPAPPPRAPAAAAPG